MAEILFNAGDDPIVKSIFKMLEQYEEQHPRSRATVYRMNPAAVRIRIIDPGFNGLNRIERDEKIWPLVRQLPDEAQQDISMLLLLSPKESKTNLQSANDEFNDPQPTPAPVSGSKRRVS